MGHEVVAVVVQFWVVVVGELEVAVVESVVFQILQIH